MFWLALGAWQAWRGPSLYGKASQLARLPRVGAALGALILALISLFVPIGFMFKTKAIDATAMSLPVWFAVTVIGLLFVGLQSFAMALLATLARDAAVTRSAAPASTSQDSIL